MKSLALAALLALTPVTASATCQLAPMSQVQAVTSATNQYRARSGAPALAVSDKLSMAAQKHACHIAASGQFSHTGAGGSSVGKRVSAEGYGYSLAGENLAGGHPNTMTAQTVVQMWAGSSGHAGNMLNPGFSQTGVGMTTAQNGDVIWVAVYAAPGQPRKVIRRVIQEPQQENTHGAWGRKF